MSEAKHTQGKAIPAVASVSQIGSCYAVGMQDTKVTIAITGKFGKPDSDISEANAHRIAACWNACEGIDTGMLENITTLGDTLASRFMMRDKVERDLQAQRDELLEYLQYAVWAHPELEKNEKLMVVIAKATTHNQPITNP